MFSLSPKQLNLARNISLVLVFVLPVIFVSLGLILTMRPVTTELPQYNFIYSQPGDYNDKFEYKINDNKIFQDLRPDNECIDKIIDNSNQVITNNRCTSTPKLYYHNVTTNKSEAINFEQVTTYKLISNSVSPDGFRFESYSNGGYSSFLSPFGSSKNQRNVLIKNSSIIPQSVNKDNKMYDSINFLAWHDNK